MHHLKRRQSIELRAEHESRSEGFTRAALVDGAAGSVHMGLGLCRLEDGHLDAHVQSCEESFYVLEGELLMHIDGGERSLAAGAFASVPAGLPHAYVVSSEAARSLIVITPGSGAMEAFFRDAGEPAAERALPAEGPLDIERIGAAAERTGAVKIIGPPPFGESAV